jgi:hypothetical protein
MGRRNSEVELCFDSMSDLITNLAGGLILVVMLLLCVTREAPKAADPEFGGNGKRTAGEKPSRELFNRLNLLQIEATRLEDGIATDGRTLRELEKKANELLTKAKVDGKGAK